MLTPNMRGSTLRWVLWVGVISACSCSSSDDPPQQGDDITAGHSGGHDSGVHADADAAAMRADASGDESAFDPGHDPNRNQVEPGHVCARLAVIECAGEALCCEHPSHDVAACRSTFEQTCTGVLLLDALSAAPAVGFDADVASAAFSELERRAAMCDPQIAAWAASADGFGASFTGSLSKSADCKPDGGVDASSADLAAALASCQVSANLACLPTKAAWTCMPRSSRSGVCFTDLNCADGLYCDNPGSLFDGVCSERLPSGEACTDASQCASLMCKAGKCAPDDDVQAAYCL
jgi:hypothetical protein